MPVWVHGGSYQLQAHQNVAGQEVILLQEMSIRRLGQE